MEDDFTIDDESSGGYNQDPGEKQKIIKFVIIVVVAAVVGLTVYFITDALINGNKKGGSIVVTKDTEMELNDEMVIYLYDNVTYSVNGIRNDKFFKNGSVTADSFTNQEKFYYALRYAVEADFVDMSTTNSGEDVDDSETAVKQDNSNTGPVTYSISNERIREYMFNFFGDGVTYDTNTPVYIAVNFAKNGMNAGTLNYDASSDSFLIQFDSVSDGVNNYAINPYLYKLESAMREGKTNNIILKERVVFTSTTQYKDENEALIDMYDCGIYKDYGKSTLLEQKTGVTKTQLMMLGIENYQNSSSIVTYTFFKDDNDQYHFLSSEISS